MLRARLIVVASLVLLAAGCGGGEPAEKVASTTCLELEAGANFAVVRGNWQDVVEGEGQAYYDEVRNQCPGAYAAAKGQRDAEAEERTAARQRRNGSSSGSGSGSSQDSPSATEIDAAYRALDDVWDEYPSEQRKELCETFRESPQDFRALGRMGAQQIGSGPGSPEAFEEAFQRLGDRRC